METSPSFECCYFVGFKGGFERRHYKTNAILLIFGVGFLNAFKIIEKTKEIQHFRKDSVYEFNLCKSEFWSIFENTNSKLLIENSTHPNLLYIKKKHDKKNIEVDQIREVIKFTYQSSLNNKSRFIIIDDVEFLNTNSSNALLKSLEEPNDNVYFFLLFNSEMNILDTIKSRCLEYKIDLKINDTKRIVDTFFNENIYRLNYIFFIAKKNISPHNFI